MKKLLSDSRNLTKKRLNYIIFFKNRGQIDTKKNWRTNLIFLNKNKNQKHNPKIYIQTNKNIIFTFFYDSKK